MTSPGPAADDLIKRIKARVPGYELHRNGPLPPPAPPFEAANRERLEREIGFRLPDLLVRLYQDIGNGGFGPGYGLMGLGEGGFTDDISNTADGIYLRWRSDDARRERFHWPKGLLPICHLGCAMYACVEIGTEEILIWEPNAWIERQSPKTAIFRTGKTLTDWLSAWAAGERVSSLTYYGVDHFSDLAPLAPLPANRSRNRKVPPDQTDFLREL